MNQIKTLFVALILLIGAFGVQAQPPTSPTCSDIPLPQFAQSTNTSTVINGVTVTRTMNRARFSVNQAINCCQPWYRAGYPHLNSEYGGGVQESVTYTFDVPQTSAQVFLMIMGNLGSNQKYAIDQAVFSIKQQGDIPINNFNLYKYPTGIDCKGRVNVIGSMVELKQENELLISDAAIVVESSTPFTSLTITNPRTSATYGTIGFGYYVEICPNSITPLPIDTDGDGVPDIDDLDKDNDGILDIDELYCHNPDLPVAATVGRGQYKTQLGFFDFTNAQWTNVGDKVIREATYNGVKYIAEVTYTGVFNKVKPTNSTTNLLELTNSTIVPVFKGANIDTWSGGPAQMIKNFYNVNGNNYQEVIHAANQQLFGEATFKIDVRAEKAGVPVPFQLVVFDAEATSFMLKNNWPEQIRFIDTGKGFQSLEKTGTGNYDDLVTITEHGYTRTVKKVELSADNYTLSYNYTDNNVSGEPSNVNGLFETIDYNSSRHVVNAIVRANGGAGAFGFAVRTLCDADSDGIPNFLDLDSDDDGCYDAIEGDEKVTTEHLNNDGSINIAATGGVNADGVPNLVNPGGAADTDGLIGQGAGFSKNPRINACIDTDGDGIPDIYDLDNDNDGILDTSELHCDNLPDLHPTDKLGAFKKQLGFFNFAGKTWNQIGQTHSSTVEYDGVSYTADVTYYDVDNRNTPSGNTDFYLSPTNLTTPIFEGSDIDTWPGGGPTHMIRNYYNVGGAAFKEAIAIKDKSLQGEAKFRIKVKAHKVGQPAVSVPFKLVVFDAEATSLRIQNNWTEDINFIDFGKGFQLLEKTGTGNYNELVTVTAPGGYSITVPKIGLSEDKRILTYNYTDNNVSGNPSNVNALFETIDHTSSEHFIEVRIKARVGGGAFGFAVRTLCDTDSDGIPNFLDTDSDGDDCPDAVEGDENVTESHLNADGSINIVDNGGVNANGVPNLVNAGGIADVGGDEGQGVGSSQNNAVNACIIVEATNDINQIQENSTATGNVLYNDYSNKSMAITGAKCYNENKELINLTFGTATTIYTADGTLAGTMTFNQNGTYTFVPAPGFTGTVPVEYTIADNTSGVSDSAQLSINVVPKYNSDPTENNPPIANNDTQTAETGKATVINVLANDSDPDNDNLTITGVTGKGQGSTTVTLSNTPQDIYDETGTYVIGQAHLDANNNIVFTPTAGTGFLGDTTFDYTISDGKGGTASAKAVVTVVPADTISDVYANDDAKAAPVNTPISGNILGNDHIENGHGSLLVIGSTAKTIDADNTSVPIAEGTLIFNRDGSYTFTPNDGFVGTVTLPYMVCNTQTPAVCDNATLYLTSLDTPVKYWVGTPTSNDFNTPGNWTTSVVPSYGDDIVFATNANNNNNPAKNDMKLPAGTKSTIGNLTNESNFATVIPANTSLTITGTVTGSSTLGEAHKLVVGAEKDKANATLIVTDGCNQNIFGTVQLYGKGIKGEEQTWTDNIVGSPTYNKTFTTSYQWQYFGVPVESIIANPTFHGASLRVYDETYNGDNKQFYQKWHWLSNDSVLRAFKGYSITQPTAKTYNIAGKLEFCGKEITMTRKAAAMDSVGAGTLEQNRRYGLGQNLFGNSYTAAIDISKLVLPTNVEQTIYMYNTGRFHDWASKGIREEAAPNQQSAGNWFAIPKHSAGIWNNEIPSMQGFMLKFTDGELANGVGADQKIQIPYEVAGTLNVIPNTKQQLVQGQRVGSTTEQEPLSYLRVNLESASTRDALWLISQEGTTNKFDDGWDGRKHFGTPTAFIFTENKDGLMQVNADETIDGSVISFYANADTEYELTLIKSNLAQYSNLHLHDLVSKTSVVLDADTTYYRFSSTNKGYVEKRFVILNSDRSIFNDDSFSLLDAYLKHNEVLVVSNLSAKDGHVNLYDTSGRRLLTREMPVGIIEIPINLSQGVYLVNLQTDSNRETIKIVVR